MSEHDYGPKNQSPQGYVDELLSGKKETDDPTQLALLTQLSQTAQQIKLVTSTCAESQHKIAMIKDLQSLVAETSKQFPNLSFRVEALSEEKVAELQFKIAVISDLRSRVFDASKQFYDLSFSSVEILSEELGILNKFAIEGGALPSNEQVIKLPDKDDFEDLPEMEVFFAEELEVVSVDIPTKALELVNIQEDADGYIFDSTEDTFSLYKKDTPHRIHGFIDAVAGLPKYDGHGAPSLEECGYFTQEVVMVYLTPDKEIEPDVHFLTIARIIGLIGDGFVFGMTQKTQLFHLLSALAAQLKIFDAIGSVGINKDDFEKIKTLCFGIVGGAQSETACGYVFGLCRSHVPGGEGIIGDTWEEILSYHGSYLQVKEPVVVVHFSDADRAFQDALLDADDSSNAIRELFRAELNSSRFYKKAGVPPTVGFLAKSYIQHLSGTSFKDLRHAAKTQEYIFET